MTTLLGIGPAQLVAGLLIFVRVLGIFTAAPVFSHAHLPTQVKLALAVMISAALLPVVHAPDPRIGESVLLLGAAAVKEAIVGLILGYVATLAFVAIQLAGEVADIQIGFGFASIADPLLNTHTSLIGQFQYIVATLLFLVANGHHLVLSALVRSFELVPLDGFVFHALLAGRILGILGDLFVVGMTIGAPVLLAVFLADLGLGVVGRAMPQMNLMVVGFPIKTFIGLSMLIVALPLFAIACQSLFDGLYRDMLTVLHAM